MAEQTKIIDIRHPYWRGRSVIWRKWRTIFEGGDWFVHFHLRKFSERETDLSFRVRKEITPAPSFAKAAINDIKNSIFQRLTDIVRRGGSDNYQNAVKGQNNGVNLHGASMNTYIGREVLPELLTMARVGIYVDAPPILGPSIADQQGAHPYLYTYKTEEILSWSYRRDRVDEFQSLLLRDWVDDYDYETGLPRDQWCRYRHIWLDENHKVNIQFYDDDANATNMEGEVTGKNPIILDIDRIPFVVLELTDSLLADVANHQIALLNMESSDVSYALLANSPFYTEQQDDNVYSDYLKQEAGTGSQGTAAEVQQSRGKEIKVGATQGRTYGKTLDRPGFIHPSSEPLMASMKKQEQLKADIRLLVNLSLANVQAKMASAESKSLDLGGLEAGLSYIGLELEHAERKVADYWHMYEKAKATITVQYPESYSLQTDDSRRADVKQLEELRDSLPSERFQKSISKEMAQKLLGGKVSLEEMDIIFQEIDSAKCFTASPDTIFTAVESGIMSLDIAATLLGLPKESVQQAAEDHAARAARVAIAQSDAASRGVPDLSANLAAGSQEKTASTDTTLNPTVTDKQRGAGQ